MAAVYYPQFSKLLAKNNRIKWVVNYNAKEQLLEIGWPEANLVRSTRKRFFAY